MPTHARRTTILTAPSSKRSARPNSPAVASFRGIALSRQPASVSGYRASSCLATSCNSVFALARSPPGTSRATVTIRLTSRGDKPIALVYAPSGSGSQISPSMGNCLSGGITPMISKGLPDGTNGVNRFAGWAARYAFLPTTAKSSPKRRCHNAWLMTTTWGCLDNVSAATIVRPRRARTPYVSKKSADTWSPVTFSASPCPVTVATIGEWEAKLPSDGLPRKASSRCAVDRKVVELVGGLIRSPRNSTKRSASAKGSGRNATAWATLNMAVLMPRPSPKVRSATIVKVGLRLS